MMNRKPTRLRRRLLILLLLAVAVLTALALLRVGPPPQVEIDPALPGIGRATPVTVRAAEPRRGLSRLTVELVQGEQVEPLAEESYSPRPFWAFWGSRTERDELALTVGSESVAGLAEGKATLRVTAERAGTWLRRPPPVVAELELPVQLAPPTLAVLSSQVNLAQGGSEAVVYRLGPTAVRHGVQAGEAWFPGYPLPGGGEGEFFALFAAPWDLEEPGAVRLVAADAVGNEVAVPFVDRFQRRPPRDAVIRLDDAFLARVVPEIVARTPAIEDRGDPLANYLEVNGELRQINARQLVELAANSRPELLWSEPFVQLADSQVMASFADRRSYRYHGEEVDRQTHLGFDLASVRRAPVEAANRGVVVMAEYFGIYGNTVVLDHGYGLMTLYAHLSSFAVAPGDQVERGQELGRTGETGLAGGDHLHFTFLLHGTPVNPLEWWDPRWIRDHLVAKLGPALPFSG